MGRGAGGGARTAKTLTRGGLVREMKDTSTDAQGTVRKRMEKLTLTNADGSAVTANQKRRMFDRNFVLNRANYERLDERSRTKVVRSSIMGYNQLYPRVFPSKRGEAMKLMRGLKFTDGQMRQARQIGSLEGKRRAYINRAKKARDPKEKRMNYHKALAMQTGGAQVVATMRGAAPRG